MDRRPPLMFVPLKINRKIARKFRGIAGRLSGLFPNLDADLKRSDIDLAGRDYLGMAIVNAGVFFVLFFLLFFYLLYEVQFRTLEYSLIVSFGAGFGVFIVMFFLIGKYPKIIAGKRVERIDKNLLFVLKDMTLQIGSGVSLYNSMINIANSKYGDISEEFKKSVRQIDSGMPIDKALEDMALRSKSEYLKRTVWQILNTFRAGASLEGALRSIINDLTIDQRAKIRDYAGELNVWSLMYMLFAVAVPTIGITMMIILSSFAGFSITPVTVMLFIALSFFVQFALIGFIKSRRPVIEF